MDTVNKFVEIDSEFYKIIESWTMLEKPMKDEYDVMVKENDIEKASVRENMLNSLQVIVQLSKEYRVCLSNVAKEYNIDVSLYVGDEVKYDPIDILVKVFEEGYFKALCNSLDNFIETIDVDKKFEKKECKIDTEKEINTAKEI